MKIKIVAKHKKTNPVAVAMTKRYGSTSLVHGDKRMKRQTRRSWMKEYDNE